MPAMVALALIAGVIVSIVGSMNAHADYFTGCTYGYGAGATGFGSGSGIGYGYGYSQDGSTFAYGYGNQVCPTTTTSTPISTTSAPTTSTTTTTTPASPPPVVTGLPPTAYQAVESLPASTNGAISTATPIVLPAGPGAVATAPQPTLSLDSSPGALPVGTKVAVSVVSDTAAAQKLLPSGNTLELAIGITWTAPGGAHPTANSPITAMVKDPSILEGDFAYEANQPGSLTKIGVATNPGIILFSFTGDPLIVIAHASTTTTTSPTTTTTVHTRPSAVPGRDLVNFGYFVTSISGPERHGLLVLKAKLQRGATIEIIGYAYHDRALALRRALNARSLLTRGKPMHVRLVLMTKYRVNRVLVIPVKQ